MGPELDRAVDEGCHLLRDDIEISMQQPKHGKVYKSTHSLTGAATHQASALGESPAIESSDYLNSIKPVMITKLGKGGVGSSEGAVYTDDKVGTGLEFGTKHIAARPHFTPSSQSIWPDFIDECVDAVLRAIK
jgi:hypothetical protein